MSWQEDMLPGALNGVPIHVKTRTLKGGRRTTLHEFVGSEEQWSEDTGKFPIRFTVDFVVIGDDYFIDRDRVIDILESKGPYIYTDPFRGDVGVAMEGEYECKEAGDGVADFRVTFHRAGPLEFPIIVDPSFEVKKLVSLAHAKIELAHKDRFTLGKLIKAILRGLGKANTALRGAKGSIAQKLGLIDSLSNELSQLEDNINDLAGTPQDFANAFKRLGAQIISLVKTWAESHVPKIPDGSGPLSSDLPGIQVLLEVAEDFRSFDAGADEVDITTPDGEQEKRNLEAIDALVGQTMFVEIAGGLVDLEPDTAEKAVEAKEAMAAWADDLLNDVDIDDEVYEAVADIAAAFVNYQVTVGQNLPNEHVFLARNAMPACVISQQVYGVGDRDLEIIQRNNLRHPLFAEGEIRMVKNA